MSTILEDILQDFSASFWLKNAIVELNKRDPLDAIRDVEMLVLALKQRYRNVLADHGIFAPDVSPQEIRAIEISSGAIIIDCPQCQTSHNGFVRDPRGSNITCEGCGRVIPISETADVRFS